MQKTWVLSLGYPLGKEMASHSSILLSFFSPFIFISWRLITLQYCSGFCHTLTWISHGFPCVPHPDPPSHLPPHPFPLGLPSAPALSLGIHTEETRSERHVCTPVFIAALFIIARIWKEPRCPSADEWIRKLWYIYTMEYHSAIKKNSFESVLMRWVKLEPIIWSEVSQKDKDQFTPVFLPGKSHGQRSLKG